MTGRAALTRLAELRGAVMLTAVPAWLGLGHVRGRGAAVSFAVLARMVPAISLRDARCSPALRTDQASPPGT